MVGSRWDGKLHDAQLEVNLNKTFKVTEENINCIFLLFFRIYIQDL